MEGLTILCWMQRAVDRQLSEKAVGTGLIVSIAPDARDPNRPSTAELGGHMAKEQFSPSGAWYPWSRTREELVPPTPEIQTMSDASNFFDVLHSNAPASDRAEKTSLYARLVGRWEMDVVIYKNDGAKHSTHGLVCASWVLEGRAIQDVFAVPGLFYGTTLRVYDPDLDAWHVLRTDPLNQVYVRLIGRPRGNDIVNEGKEPASLARLYGVASAAGMEVTIRWSFTDIMPSSFNWRSERSIDGVNWQLQREFFARRVSVS